MAKRSVTPLPLPPDFTHGNNSGSDSTGDTSTDASTGTGQHGISAGSGDAESGSGRAESGSPESGSGSGSGTVNSGHSIDDAPGDSGSGSGNAPGNFRVYGSDGVDTGRAGDSTGDTAPITSASGRHKRKQCPCEKCTEWRRISGVPVQVDNDGDAPASVPFAALGGRKRNLAKSLTTETLGIVVSAAYELPQMMLPSGAADHWPLSEREEKTIVTRLEAVIDMLPTKTKNKGIEAISKIAPPLALIVTAFLMTKPRIDMTRDALARMRLAAQRRPPTPTDQTNASVEPLSGTGNREPIVGDITARRAATPAVDPNGSGNAASGSHGNDQNGNGRNGHTASATRHNTALSDATF